MLPDIKSPSSYHTKNKFQVSLKYRCQNETKELKDVNSYVEMGKDSLSIKVVGRSQRERLVGQKNENFLDVMSKGYMLLY